MDKILVADDEQDIREIMQVILQKEGYEVVLAKDGAEVLALVKQTSPDLIVLDYLMPGTDGIEACQALKKDSSAKGIPVIMVTAYPNEKEKGLAAGAVDFITKPVDRIDLLLRIKSALKVKHITNELQRIIAYIAELEK